MVLKKMIRNPRTMGAISPSSPALCKRMVREALQAVESTTDFVVELGPGTGCITAALLARGVAPDRLICVELDPELHKYMTDRFPEVQIILGDAAKLEEILDKKCGKIAAIVSGIPLKNLPLAAEKKIVRACHAALRPQGKMVQFTYGIRPTSTVPGFERTFSGFVLLNLPPAFVWTFTKVQ